jgi:hypothetical protein
MAARLGAIASVAAPASEPKRCARPPLRPNAAPGRLPVTASCMCWRSGSRQWLLDWGPPHRPPCPTPRQHDRPPPRQRLIAGPAHLRRSWVVRATTGIGRGGRRHQRCDMNFSLVQSVMKGYFSPANENLMERPNVTNSNVILGRN